MHDKSVPAAIRGSHRGEHFKNSSNSSKSKRTYTYDDAGNRATMVTWNDASVNRTTTYAYGDRNEMTSNDGYLDDGTHDTNSMSFDFDSRGNMTAREWGDGATDQHRVEMEWNEDNRMIVHSRFSDYEEQGPLYETETITEFHYDASGRRLLKRAPRVSTSGTPTQRTRYFFNGLTEEIAKVSVPGAHSDSAFEFVTEEDGNSASEWYHSVSGSGISVSSVSDTARRSNVIKCQNDSEAKPVFRIGEKDGTSENPNDSAWDSTKRVVSFWMKGECASMNVQVSASTGAKYVQYLFGTGTNGALSGGNAKVYLGYAAPEDWVRFERNVEADFEAYAGGGATWTNTDGLYISWPKSLLSYAFYVDDLRLSDSLTVEHNTLGPGVIGHILRHTTWDATTLARTDRWFHYDQVGSVLNESDANGDDVTRHEQDAFGNVMQGWSGGLWDVGTSRLNSRYYDTDMGVLVFRKRAMDTGLGVFLSAAGLPPSEESRYAFAEMEPVASVDPNGAQIVPVGTKAAQDHLNACIRTLKACHPDLCKMLEHLENSDYVHTIKFGGDPGNGGYGSANYWNVPQNAWYDGTTGAGSGSGSRTYIDPNQFTPNTNTCTMMAHEFKHAYDADRGMINLNPTTFPGGTWGVFEDNAVTAENKARSCLWKTLRPHYGVLN